MEEPVKARHDWPTHSHAADHKWLSHSVELVAVALVGGLYLPLNFMHPCYTRLHLALQLLCARLLRVDNGFRAHAAMPIRRGHGTPEGIERHWRVRKIGMRMFLMFFMRSRRRGGWRQCRARYSILGSVTCR